MPGNIDDFMSRFGGNDTVSDDEVNHYHQRFTSTHPDDNDFDNDQFHQSATQYLGKLPDDDFQQKATAAIAHASPQERQGFLGSIMGALGGGGGGGLGGVMGGALGSGAGGGIGQIAQMLGLGSADPARMSDDDAAKVLNYARTQKPEVLQRTMQEKPWFMKAMGNPLIMGALGMIAARMFKNRSQ